MNIFLNFAATFIEEGTGNTNYDEDYDISVQAHGTIEAGNINFAFDEFSDWNGDVIAVNGTVSGTVADNGRSVAVLRVDYGTYNTSTGERTTRYTLSGSSAFTN